MVDPLDGSPITLGNPVLVAKVEASAMVESCADGDTGAVCAAEMATIRAPNAPVISAVDDGATTVDGG